MLSRKKISIILISTITLIFVLLWFALDLNSEIGLFLHPEKYSFNLNFASQFVQNDYYMGKTNPESLTIYRLLKTTEEYNKDKNDDISKEIMKFNNLAFDMYHDIISKQINNAYFLTSKDLQFIRENSGIEEALLFVDSEKPNIETYSILHKELLNRKDLIKVIKKDLQDKKIDATISINDINYENLFPVYINDDLKPQYIKDFDKILDVLEKRQEDVLNKNLSKCKQIKDKDNAIDCFINANRESRKFFYNDILNNIDESYRHRYLALAIEKKKNGDKVFHLYEAHPYKEGNRYYWDIQYYPPTSEFLKAYLKMLEILMNF